MILRHIALAAALALTACTGTETLYATPPTEVSERIASRYKSVEVLEVSLPNYASGDEILVSATDGTLRTGGLLWADNPTREVTLSLSRALSEITGARVAPAPWPFDSFPNARVDVRVERFLAEGGTHLVLRGQYFVADLDEQKRDRARLFDLRAPLPSEAALPDLLAARSALIADLAVMIARDGLK